MFLNCRVQHSFGVQAEKQRFILFCEPLRGPQEVYMLQLEGFDDVFKCKDWIEIGVYI